MASADVWPIEARAPTKRDGRTLEDVFLDGTSEMAASGSNG